MKCPVCQQKKKRYPNLKITEIKKNIQKDDFILLKDYSKLNEKIVAIYQNYVIFIDFGYIKSLLYLKKEELKSFLFSSFFIMSIKEEVLKFILKRLSLSKEELLKNGCQINGDYERKTRSRILLST